MQQLLRCLPACASEGVPGGEARIPLRCNRRFLWKKAAVSKTVFPQEKTKKTPNGWEQYETYVAQLGWLMSSNGWETAEDLSPTDYVMWYGYRVYDLPSSAEYQIEGRDGLFFPAEELESQVASYFDVPAAHLRSDPVIYLEAEQLYQTPAALMPLAESNFEITDVTEADSIIQITFTLDFVEFDLSREMTLTLEKTADSVHYLSYQS